MRTTSRQRTVTLAGAIAALAVLILPATGPAESRAGGAITPPPQPNSGPGGSDYTHGDYRVSSGGSGSDAWFVFEPTKPRPKVAPVTIVMHGYFEFSGYGSQQALIEHTVRKGSIVIYPRWQTGIAEPCPGPFNIEPCMQSARNGILGALSYLRSSKAHVQPNLRRASYFAHSFGGIITTNLANRWRDLGIPKPRVVFLDDPHDGGFNEPNEGALDDSLAGIPSSTLFQCHSGADGVFNDPYEGTGDPTQIGQPKRDASCNSVFPKLTSIPAKNKDLVLTRTDDHGDPSLSSDHGVCSGGGTSGPGAVYGQVDAYDWNFCWKVWDALRSCAFEGRYCRYALGDTRKHRSMGKWSDGVPVTPLKIQDKAPIRP